MCSLYADDTAIFLPDLDMLLHVLWHINWVGSFTGLHLNLDKTIAFDPGVTQKLMVAGVQVCCAPVKYLGAYLGIGDLSKLNFEAPFQKMKSVLSKWSKRPLTLDARILVCKVFTFSVFTHVLNCVFISTYQLEIIQKALLDFVWKGKSCVHASVMMALYDCGGLQISCVKNVVHTLLVKWLNQIANDVGATWWRLCWGWIIDRILSLLWHGIRKVSETDLNGLPAFYTGIL